MQSAEDLLAAVVADAAVNKPHCQIITWTLPIIWQQLQMPAPPRDSREAVCV